MNQDNNVMQCTGSKILLLWDEMSVAVREMFPHLSSLDPQGDKKVICLSASARICLILF